MGPIPVQNADSLHRQMTENAAFCGAVDLNLMPELDFRILRQSLGHELGPGTRIRFQNLKSESDAII